jgi:plastocyanin
MRNTFALIKNSIYLLCSVFFLSHCTSSSGRIEGKSYVIEIKKMKFDPAELTVEKGDTVVWINNDIVTHDVTEEIDKLWTSGPLAPGESWSLVITKSADYFCSIHVVMKGKLLAP